ncbi:phage tail termination protein [Streptomyces sp. NPDC000941]
MPARMLPSAADLLVGVLRPALAVATVGTLIPDPMPLPFVLARPIGGAAVDMRFLARAVVDVQTWAETDRDAEDLAAAARAALVTAWRQQVVVPGVGSVGWLAERAAPVLLPDEHTGDGVYRYQAAYELTIRPAS